MLMIHNYIVSFDVSSPSIAIDKINLCILDLRTWMIKNKLKINDSKTEFIIITSTILKKMYDDMQLEVGNSTISPTANARNLGVIFNKCMNLDAHIGNVCKATYFQLRNIGSIRKVLSDDACAQLIHCLVNVRIDYCNSLLYGLSDSSLFRLQKILNTAARILCRIPKHDHI